jgi:hypothetical protein
MNLDPIGPPGSAVEVFGVVGCSVCQAEPAIEAEAVTWFCRQAFDDPDGRGRVLAAGGLCPRHWWRVATEEESSRATMLGTAELLANVLDRHGQLADRAASCPICADVRASLAHRPRTSAPSGLRGAVARAAGNDPRQAVRTALRQAKQLAETGEVLEPDTPPTSRRTLRNLPLELATRRARGEGRL